LIIYKLLEACRESGCPVCRLEQQGVERYLDNQFYENVNSTSWRDHLRASQAFCHEHAWLSVNKRLGDALGFSIIYHDVINSVLKHLHETGASARSSHRRTSLPRQFSEALRSRLAKTLAALTPGKRCPICDHRDQITRDVLSTLVEDLLRPELTEALQGSEGLCLPHLKLALGSVTNDSVYESLLAIQRAKLEGLKDELAEFIRKNDYQAIKEGFGREGDAWLRAIGMVAGRRRD
jgi:hypothetical protein